MRDYLLINDVKYTYDENRVSANLHAFNKSFVDFFNVFEVKEVTDVDYPILKIEKIKDAELSYSGSGKVKKRFILKSTGDSDLVVAYESEESEKTITVNFDNQIVEVVNNFNLLHFVIFLELGITLSWGTGLYSPIIKYQESEKEELPTTPKMKSITNYENFKTFQKAEWIVDGKVFFTGMVQLTGRDNRYSPEAVKTLSLKLVDYKDFLSRGAFVNQVFKNKKPSEILFGIKEDLENYGITFEESDLHLQNDEKLVFLNAKDLTLFQLLETLQQLTNSVWSIEDNKLHFDTVESLNQAPDFKICDERLIEIDFSQNNNDTFNQKRIISDNVVSDKITRKNVTIKENKEVNFLNKITNLKVFSGSRRLVVKNSLQIEAGEMWEVNFDDNTDFFEVNENYTNSTFLTVEYNEVKKSSITINNFKLKQEIAQRSGTTGEVTAIERESYLITESNLIKKAKNEIEKNAVNKNVFVLRSFENLFKIRDKVNLITGDENEGLYFVKKIQIDQKGFDKKVYTFTLISKLNRNTDINFFDLKPFNPDDLVEPDFYETDIFIDFPLNLIIKPVKNKGDI